MLQVRSRGSLFICTCKCPPPFVLFVQALPTCAEAAFDVPCDLAAKHEVGDKDSLFYPELQQGGCRVCEPQGT